MLPTFGLTRCRSRFASGVQASTQPGRSVSGADRRRFRRQSGLELGGTVRPRPTRVQQDYFRSTARMPRGRTHVGKGWLPSIWGETRLSPARSLR